MVCCQCKDIVKDELNKLGIDYSSVELGEVTLLNKLTSSKRKQLANRLLHSGFELIAYRKNAIIEKLKQAITDLNHFSDEDLKMSFSDYLSLRVDENFISLNKLFSEIEGVTIEKYILIQKIDLVKELLMFKELTLAEIAIKLHYSGTAQLSSQFKSITGLTPIHFRELRQNSISNRMYN